MNTYNIGPLTDDYVFKMSGLTNVSDLQAVLDAVEVALKMKNQHFRDMMAEMQAEIDKVHRDAL